MSQELMEAGETNDLGPIFRMFQTAVLALNGRFGKENVIFLTVSRSFDTEELIPCPRSLKSSFPHVRGIADRRFRLYILSTSKGFSLKV